MKPTASNSSRAYTLAEILVVIVILAALTAILFPVFARARENARRAVCISNLRQLGLAITMYRIDWGGVDPQVGLPLSHSALGLPHYMHWYYFKTHYIKNRDILYCPSFTDSRQEWASSYSLEFMTSEYNYPSWDYEQIASLRGMDYPLAICLEHNPKVPRAMRHDYETNIYHVLRIDGRVDIRKASLAEPLSLRNW
jgi:type II secretory pathway pseudopilin PulG